MTQLLKLSYALLWIFPVTSIYSQNETSKWYFGTQAGLDFMTNPPTILTNGAMSTAEGCCSVADPAGNLLFYTDGSTVYNNLNVAMANGTGLLGFSSSSQSAIIVKKPGNTNIFYVFTQGATPNGTRYSIIDMNLSAGQGSVTTKNVILQMPSTEKLTSVRHCNGVDIWVMTHDVVSNVFRAYLVNSAGVNPIAVTSTVGVTYAGADFVGILKFSPNRKKLAASLYGPNAAFEIYDFDPSTGFVSNPLLLGSNLTVAYGVEFSPDGSKLYGARFANPSLYQWDLCAGSNSAIAASMYTVTSSGIGKGQLQLASNGKIYVARNGPTDLGVINNPNIAGSGCNFVEAGQSIFPKTSQMGLPNFIASGINPPTPFTYTVNNTFGCLTASFTAPSTSITNVGCGSTNSPPNVFIWYFGEPSSGIANTSVLSNPVHNYLSAGTYTVKLLQYGNCSSDTVLQTVTIVPTTTMAINGSTSVCSGQSTTLTATGVNLYTWNSVTVSPSIIVTPSGSVTFSVVGTATPGNCQVMQAITVTVLALPSVSVSGNFSICSGNQTTLTSTGANTYSWSNGNATSFVIVLPNTTTTYSVTGTDSATGCSASNTVTVNVFKCLGIENLNIEKIQATFYPNPFNGSLNIDSDMEASILIYDHLGRLIYRDFLQRGNNFLNLSSLQEGIYFARIVSWSGTQTTRLIKSD